MYNRNMNRTVEKQALGCCATVRHTQVPQQLPVFTPERFYKGKNPK